MPGSILATPAITGVAVGWPADASKSAGLAQRAASATASFAPGGIHPARMSVGLAQRPASSAGSLLPCGESPGITLACAVSVNPSGLSVKVLPLQYSGLS